MDGGTLFVSAGVAEIAVATSKVGWRSIGLMAFCGGRALLDDITYVVIKFIDVDQVHRPPMPIDLANGQPRAT